MLIGDFNCVLKDEERSLNTKASTSFLELGEEEWAD